MSLLAGAAVGSRFIRSPADVAADSAPPPFSVLTAAVESRVLASSVTGAAQVVSAGSVEVTAPASETPGYRSVVTGIPVRLGAQVDAGSVLVEVAGSPVFAMPGTVPAYRPLRQGTRGRDVAQLQRGLNAAGNSTAGDPSGVFGPRTATAVAALYREAGYPPPGTGDGLVVPTSALAVVPALPARVDAVLASVGDPAQGQPVLRLSTGALLAQATLDSIAAAAVRPGFAAQIIRADSDEPVPGEVVDVRPAPAANGESGDSGGADKTIVTVRPDTAFSADLAGSSVRVRVVTAAMTEPGTVVPVGALSADQSGAVFVNVVDGSTTTAVKVRVGLIADGYAQVSATPPLTAGSKVRLGLTQGAAEPAPAPS